MQGQSITPECADAGLPGGSGMEFSNHAVVELWLVVGMGRQGLATDYTTLSQ